MNLANQIKNIVNVSKNMNNNVEKDPKSNSIVKDSNNNNKQ